MNITEGATGAAAGADAENERTPVVLARQASMNITQGATGAAGGDGAGNERTPHIYRPDIDGLRTVAVTAVVFFHFIEPIYPGNLPRVVSWASTSSLSSPATSSPASSAGRSRGVPSAMLASTPSASAESSRPSSSSPSQGESHTQGWRKSWI
jgi:hypothetical protein